MKNYKLSVFSYIFGHKYSIYFCWDNKIATRWGFPLTTILKLPSLRIPPYNHLYWPHQRCSQHHSTLLWRYHSYGNDVLKHWASCLICIVVTKSCTLLKYCMNGCVKRTCDDVPVYVKHVQFCLYAGCHPKPLSTADLHWISSKILQIYMYM